jgi:hypothetical protein
MALPKLERPIYDLTLPISKQKLKYHPYVIGEEKVFLTAMEGQKVDKKNVVENLINLASNCVLTEGFDINKLSFIDFVYLLSMLRAKSKGEIVESIKKCTNKKCGKDVEFSIDIENDIKIKNGKKIMDTYKINDKVFLELKPISINLIRTVDEKTTEYDVLIDSIVNSVAKIIWNEKIYSDFTLEDLKENIIDELTEEQLQQVVKKMAKLAKIVMEKKVKCKYCKKEQTIKEENNLNFFL